MAHLGGAPTAFSFRCLLLLSFILCIHGKKAETWEEKYPFIKHASTFSSSSSSSSDSGNPGDRNDNVNGVKRQPEFDYIVIGGGTAGCPLAATLSQSHRVLLLERGGAPFGNVNVSFMRNFHISLADISPASASQMFVSTDGVINSRARVLGGGSCINAGFYTRANPRYIRDVGWDEKLVNQSYPWVEKQVVHEPILVPLQKALRDGLLEVGVSPFNGFTYDHLYGTKVGGTIFDRFGRRHTAAELLASANPEKISVLIYASVQKIVFDTTGKNPRAIGVIFKDENGKEHKAFISRRKGSEVILSSGAIGSSHLLILSGIGPKNELEKFNISMIHRNEYVGKGMIDNPLNTIFIPTKGPIEQSLIQTVGITKEGVYIEASSGFGQSTDCIHRNHGIVSAEIGQLSTIPPRLRSQAAIEAFRKKKRDLPREIFDGGFILTKVARPLSAGHISLISTKVEENPSITFNYFSHPDDVRKCAEGIRIIEKVVRSKPFTSFSHYNRSIVEKLLNLSVTANINLIPKHTNDTKFLEQFCKDTVLTIWHYHGGCHVGKVVNSEYRVLGVNRLRVVDGSVFNDSPGTNPQATVMMMGRYMGLKILRERLRKGI